LTDSGFIGPLPNEEQLINAARKDYREFEPLYDHYYEQIYRFVYRRTDDHDLAADLVSQTFMKALNSLKGFQYRGVPFGAWLHRIASNEIKKHFRAKGTKQVFSIEQQQIVDLIDFQDEESTDEEINQLVKLLADLEETELAVIELRFFEEKNFKEIAYILDMKESAVKMRTYRTLEKLRGFFKLKVND
jgi:RNA polymerase sigma-70 factor (ECF subfamily)